MSGSLADFQDDFVQSLLATSDDMPPSLRTLTLQPGFAVYRNTVMKGCIDALQANFPVVLRLVGEEWFRAAAALHVRAQPPTDARLLQYGTCFPGFLRDFPPAAELPYLEGVAQLDRFWTEAHAALDADTLAPSVLAQMPPAQLGEWVLVPHPAARWAWYEDLPIYTLWQRNRDAPCMRDDGDVIWCGEGALITRPGGKVQWTSLDAAGCAFLDACHAGQTLALACGAALACDAHADLARLMASLLEAGAFRAQQHVGS
jgi:Putative DNA-binding domain